MSNSQLRELADLYRRPLAVLFLLEPPPAFCLLHDLRRLPDTGCRITLVKNGCGLTTAMLAEAIAAMRNRGEALPSAS